MIGPVLVEIHHAVLGEQRLKQLLTLRSDLVVVGVALGALARVDMRHRSTINSNATPIFVKPVSPILVGLSVFCDHVGGPPQNVGA